VVIGCRDRVDGSAVKDLRYNICTLVVGDKSFTAIRTSSSRVSGIGTLHDEFLHI
jgi:hypothetical protein